MSVGGDGPSSSSRPAGSVCAPAIKDLSDVRVGVYWPYFRDAAPEVVASAERALRALEARGAVLVDVQIPYLKQLKFAHATTILR